MLPWEELYGYLNIVELLGGVLFCCLVFGKGNLKQYKSGHRRACEVRLSCSDRLPKEGGMGCSISKALRNKGTQKAA